MDQLLSKHRKRLHFAPKPRRLTSVVMMLIIITGVMSALFAGISADLNNREYLRGRAQTIAGALPSRSIAFLEGRDSDADTVDYRDLKQRLERLKADNPDLSFVYIMDQRDDQVVFLVDSSPVDHPDYSPPGQVYDEASSRLRSAFNSSEPVIEGPSRDRWGIWLSAFAPVIDPATGQTVAVVGIDTPATSYYFNILIYALVPLCLAAIPLAGLIRDRKLADKEWEMAQLKNQFVSIASHELRSPLTGLLWAIQSLLKTGDKNMTGRQKALLTDMFKSVESSTATINEILDLSVFERNAASKSSLEPVQLISTLREVKNTLNLGALEKRLSIVIDEGFPDDAFTLGDPAALRRVFMNVLSNSIKYGFEDTEIKIGYRLEDDRHVVSIRDRGIGISADEQSRVLGGYYRAANAVKVQKSGTGLGLWVSRLVAEDHGGRIWLESEVDKGTTVYVALPKHKLAGSRQATSAN